MSTPDAHRAFLALSRSPSKHPEHEELHRQTRAALLEVEMADGSIWVIERPLFAHDRVANVHQTSMAELEKPHPILRRSTAHAGEGSLSAMLLDQVGLAGISIKEAPTKTDSGTDPLSFRDLMWLCFLENTRMDNKQLLFEGSYTQHKLRQVIEVVFGVHDDKRAQLSGALKRTQEDIAKLATEITSLELFLEEHEVDDREQLAVRRGGIDAEVMKVDSRKAELDRQMRADTKFAEAARERFATASRSTRQSAATLRDRETLLRRLMPLRGQYAEDERKLTFYEQAKALFDPLRVTTCPSCVQKLPDPVTIANGDCTLCGQTVPISPNGIEVKAELASVRTRQREINTYIAEIETDLVRAQSSFESDRESELQLQRELDDQVARNLAPFVAERDVLVRQRQQLDDQLRELAQQDSWHKGIERRRAERERRVKRAAKLKEQIEELEQSAVDRKQLIRDLSGRFHSILADFGYNKLEDPKPPYLDEKFVPYVRGKMYSRAGSSGAQTLIAMAWHLAIHECALEGNAPYPGFLLIDSPQKNLSPKRKGADEPNVGVDGFGGPEFVDRVWRRIKKSVADHPSAQLIVVDNRPPAIAHDSIVVEFSQDATRPPYGFIDNEIG